MLSNQVDTARQYALDAPMESTHKILTTGQSLKSRIAHLVSVKDIGLQVKLHLFTKMVLPTLQSHLMHPSQHGTGFSEMIHMIQNAE